MSNRLLEETVAAYMHSFRRRKLPKLHHYFLNQLIHSLSYSPRQPGFRRQRLSAVAKESMDLVVL